MTIYEILGTLAGGTLAVGYLYAIYLKYNEYEDDELWEEYNSLRTMSRGGKSDDDEEARLAIIKLLLQARDLY